MKRIMFFVLTVLMMTGAQAKGNKVVVSFDYVRQNGPGSNQYAVWVENSKGEVVKTLFVTSFTSKGRARGNEPARRGYTFRPSCVPTWVKNAKAESLSDTEIDGFTGATPQQNGKQTFIWGFTDQQGKKVAAGTYKICVEATLINNCIVTYEGSFSSKDKAGKIELTSKITEPNETHKDMISNVQAEIMPE